MINFLEEFWCGRPEAAPGYMKNTKVLLLFLQYSINLLVMIELLSFLFSSCVQNKVIVANGLNKGNILITNGFINLFDGANVSIKN
jgi:hypothetical protein